MYVVSGIGQSPSLPQTVWKAGQIQKDGECSLHLKSRKWATLGLIKMKVSLQIFKLFLMISKMLLQKYITHLSTVKAY